MSHHDFLAALAERDVPRAEAAARSASEREGRPLNLADSLALLGAYADAAPEKFERAAVRWLNRYLAEKTVSLVEAQTAAAALLDLRARKERFALLLGLLR